MLSRSGTWGLAATCTKNLDKGSLMPARADRFVGRAPVMLARLVAPFLSTALLMNSHAPSGLFAFFGITQWWNEFAAVRPGCGPDCGRRAIARFLPSAFSNALITKGKTCPLAALPAVQDR